MTTNWIEETEYFLNELMEDYIVAKQMELKGNKSYYTCRNIVIIDHITTLLEKQKEEYVEMIENAPNDKINGLKSHQAGESMWLSKQDIINLIKSHDKTS